jgi:hypothetical protein
MIPAETSALMELFVMSPSTFRQLAACYFCFAAMLSASNVLQAQNLTLEGQTGGFITPTAYVVYSAKDHTLSHPAIGYHFVNTANVIGNVQTFSFTEGISNRAEFGYTRSVHTKGNSAAFSKLWDYNGMNVFHGKVVALKEGTGNEFVPGIAAGFVVRTGDHFVSGALDKAIFGVDQAYRNYDLYVAATKTWLKPPVPLLVNFGFKITNASIYGLGGQSTRQSGRLFGGLGIPLPLGHGWAAVPSAGFSQQPPQVVNLSKILFPPGSGAHIPTTLDYAVRVTQRENPHVTIDIGIGQVAGQIGYTAVPTGVANPPFVVIPINLEARHVLGLGLSYRY